MWLQAKNGLFHECDRASAFQFSPHRLKRRLMLKVRSWEVGSSVFLNGRHKKYEEKYNIVRQRVIISFNLLSDCLISFTYIFSTKPCLILPSAKAGNRVCCSIPFGQHMELNRKEISLQYILNDHHGLSQQRSPPGNGEHWLHGCRSLINCFTVTTLHCAIKKNILPLPDSPIQL